MPETLVAETLTVVIAAKNCAARLESTVAPWVPLASEIIVVDQMSVDGTAELAERLGCRLIRNQPPEGNFDLNRKLGMQEAKSDWILYIDTDERPTTELLAEINEFLKESAMKQRLHGVQIPNMFYFLGRPLRHGLFDPGSAEIRMVRRGRWEYRCEDGFHRGVSAPAGEVGRFKHAYRHFNVNSIGEWFIKTNQYTEHDACVKAGNLPMRARVARYGIFFGAFRFFVRHYFFRLGFLDGFHGLVSIFYFMLYHLTLQVKVWERIQQKNFKENIDYLKPFEVGER